ncbi:25340_t:CDS:2, partial [Gigaspora rosea]
YIDKIQEKIIGEKMFAMLNNEQKYIVDKIMPTVNRQNNNKYFFIDGPVVAWTGIAANLLPKATTVLSVVRKGSKAASIAAYIKNSYLWNHFEIMRLQQKIRANSEKEFAQWLLQLGNGTLPTINDEIEILTQFKLPPGHRRTKNIVYQEILDLE